ncbi:MAG: TraR/DksA family transcriptional regulator [Bacteriovoracaceae bacterium]|nr:TraR/DksA family transcriptional regulator [Bacteriovoracaceae bacterium]
METINDFHSETELAELKNILLAEKERIMNKQIDETQYCLDQNELSDLVDEASINLQTQQNIRFKNRENFYVKKVNKALDKMKRGTFGLCEECDGEISFERLVARPVAEMCIGCKEESEMAENSNFFQKKSKSLGKTMQEIGGR